MKRWITLSLILLVLAIAAGILVYFFIYNKPHRDFARAKPDFVMTAPELFGAFKADPQAAGQQYNGKVVEISGNVTSVERVDSLLIIVFGLQEGMFGAEGIRCTMLPVSHERAGLLKSGSPARIKGLCTGFTDTDVILEKGTISEL